jgi:hypothetical protein
MNGLSRSSEAVLARSHERDAVWVILGRFKGQQPLRASPACFGFRGVRPAARASRARVRGAAEVARYALTRAARFARFCRAAIVNRAAGLVVGPGPRPITVVGFAITKAGSSRSTSSPIPRSRAPWPKDDPARGHLAPSPTRTGARTPAGSLLQTCPGGHAGARFNAVGGESRESSALSDLRLHPDRVLRRPAPAAAPREAAADASAAARLRARRLQVRARVPS